MPSTFHESALIYLHDQAFGRFPHTPPSLWRKWTARAVDMDIWDSISQVPSLPLRISWAVSYGMFILVNVGSGLGWLGATNKEISEKFEVALTPAG